MMEKGFTDYFKEMKRGPQIITLKDAGIISAYTGLCPGMKVLDAGVGSGALTAYLANIVKPRGRVYAYDIRDDFIKIAKKNLDRMGLLKYVVIKNKNVYECIDEKVLDIITLDVAEPWRALNHAKRALKKGGFLVCYLPTITQVSNLCKELQSAGLALIKVTEVIERPWIVKGRIVRPENMILGHTGFLTFARKLQE